ncbi:MAG TPA: GNAT family N-acetyltransferase [Geothrix sp.]|nr:GNAT family N-acetyltransferase [Geothrix sp.]
MSQDLLALARRLERAQALQNERFNQAAGGRSLPVGGGFAHLWGVGHPLNQALGLLDPIPEAELEAIEAFLGVPTVLELSPAADPELWPLLAKRGYSLRQFQQLWHRSLLVPEPEVHVAKVKVVQASEAKSFNRIVNAGYLERDDWRDVLPPFEIPIGLPDAWGFIVFADGEWAGGGTLGIVDGVALLSGDAVLPRYRGRGLQKALIGARLRFAGERGCDVACASTEPGTASQRSYEACGFRVAYPKVEMSRG